MHGCAFSWLLDYVLLPMPIIKLFNKYNNIIFKVKFNKHHYLLLIYVK